MTEAIETPWNQGNERGQPNFVPVTPSELSGTPTQIEIRVQTLLYGRQGPVTGWEQIDTLVLGQISYPLGIADDTMTLIWTPDSNKWKNVDPAIRDEHFSQMIAKLSAQRLVQAYVQTGQQGNRLLFAGYPLPKTINWSADSESLTVTCVSQGQIDVRHGLRQQILGRKMRIFPERPWDRNAQDLREVSTLPPIFNAGGLPNASSELYPVKAAGGGTYAMRLFTTDDDPTAEYWNYADALRYVAYFYCMNAGAPIDVADFMADSDEFVADSPKPTSLDPFIRDMSRRCDDNVSIQSTNVDQAIEVLTSRAGLKYVIRVTNEDNPAGGFDAQYKLRVFGHLGDRTDVTDTSPIRRQIQPVERDLPRAAPGLDPTLSPLELRQRTACDVLQVTIDDRPITSPVFLGGNKRFEGTFLLRPGWEPLAEYNLDDIPQTVKAVNAAVKFWKARFNREYLDGTSREPRSEFHAEHKDHGDVADVGRLWIFPDSSDIDHETLGRLTAADIAGGVLDDQRQWVWTAHRYRPKPSDIDDEEGTGLRWYGDKTYGPGFRDVDINTWVPRWRPFEELIGRASRKTTDQTPIVRIHFGHSNGSILSEPGEPPAYNDDGWVRVMANIEFDGQRAAIRFTEANIWNGGQFRSQPSDPNGLTFLWAFILQDAWVSITASVSSDDRMKYFRFRGPRPNRQRQIVDRTQTVDFGFDRFQQNYRGNPFTVANHLQDNDFDVPPYTGRGDSESLKQLADRMAEDMSSPVTAGTASFPFLETDYQPGDVIGGSHEMGIRFARRPIIERVIITNVNGVIRTQFALTDLRDVPEATP